MTAPDDAGRDDVDLTAAELALGVLEGDERAAALRRTLIDPAFARDVELWRDYFAGLYASLPPAEPGDRVRVRVLSRPDGRAAGRRWPWLATGAAGGAAIAASLMWAVMPGRPPPPPPVPTATPLSVAIVAVLRPDSGDPIGAVYDPARHEVRLAARLVIPAGRAAEFWAIGADGVPRSLGVLPDAVAVRLLVANGRTVAAGMTLAVSIEPPGGAKGPAPTGPVVATGQLVTI